MFSSPTRGWLEVCEAACSEMRTGKVPSEASEHFRQAQPATLGRASGAASEPPDGSH